MTGFSIIERNGVKLISVDCINAAGKYRAYYSTGYGGVSHMPNDCSMNLSMFKHCINDTFENVCENFAIFARACGYSLQDMSLVHEVHGNRVMRVDRNTLPRDVFDRTSYPEADGQLTTDQSVALFVYAADCVTIMLVDPVSEVSGTVHCGWRNSVNGTIPRFLSAFRDAGGEPKNAIAALGPAVCAKHFQVSNENAEQFFALGLRDFLCQNEHNWNIDLPSIDKELLLREGLPEDQIFTAPWCTFENDLRLPSYERDNKLNASLGGILYHL